MNAIERAVAADAHGAAWAEWKKSRMWGCVTMDQITIRQRGEFEEGRGLWDVNYGDRTAECLGYDEVIGLVAAIMSRDGMPRGPMCLQWLKPRPQAWDPIAMGA